jgi:hypothetical protein
VDVLLVELVETLLEILLELVLIGLVEDLLELLLIGWVEDLLVEVLDDLLVEILESLLDEATVGTLEALLDNVRVAILGDWLDDLLVRLLLLDVLARVLLDTLLALTALVGPPIATVLLEDRVVEGDLLLDVELGSLLLNNRLLEVERFDDWDADELLIGRVEGTGVDRDTSLLRKELTGVLLDVVEAETPRVTQTTLFMVTVWGGILVHVVVAVRPDIIVAVRRAVELIVFVETWLVRTVMVLVVVNLEGTMDKHLQALDIAALFILLITAGVAHFEEAALLTSSVDWSKSSRLRIDGATDVAPGVTVQVSVI